MKTFKIILSGLLINIILLSCIAPTHSTTSQAVQTAPSFSASKYEAAILTYINSLRQNPKGFYYKYVKGYVQQKAERFTPYYTKSLKKTLLNLNPLPPLKSHPVLQTLAKKQLHYLVYNLKGRRLTHNQGNISFAERIKGTRLHCFAENIYRFPKASPLEVVLDLLIDQGVQSLGHRKNLLSPKYKLIGVETAIAPNKYKVTVIDFGCLK